MLCHLALVISVFNLGLVLFIIRRMERRRTAARAADVVLESILRKPQDRASTVRSK